MRVARNEGSWAARGRMLSCFMGFRVQGLMGFELSSHGSMLAMRMNYAVFAVGILVFAEHGMVDLVGRPAQDLGNP